LCKKQLLIGDEKKRCHPEAGEARRGTSQAVNRYRENGERLRQIGRFVWLA
jgi:hypothetical protein